MRDFNTDGVVVGRPYQEIYEQSASQKYPIGMIHERHGRRWRYSYAVENFHFAHRGCPNLNLVPGATGGDAHGIEKNLYATGFKGDTSVLVQNAAAGTLFPVDYFVGGLMVVFSTGLNPDLFCLRISGNDLFTATYGKVYVDEPLPVEVSITMGVNLHPSPYSRVGSSQSAAGARTVVVVPSIKVTAYNWFWGQTKGPCWVTPTTYGGGRNKFFNGSDGCIIDAATSHTLQFAGLAMPADTGTYGDGVILLMLE